MRRYFDDVMIINVGTKDKQGVEEKDDGPPEE